MAVLLEDLVKSIEIWLKLLKKPEPFVDPNLDPVLLVPGIAGSILKAVDEKGKEERVWVRIFGSDRAFCTKLWSRFDPKSGHLIYKFIFVCIDVSCNLEHFNCLICVLFSIND